MSKLDVFGSLEIEEIENIFVGKKIKSVVLGVAGRVEFVFEDSSEIDISASTDEEVNVSVKLCKWIDL